MRFCYVSENTIKLALFLAINYFQKICLGRHHFSKWGRKGASSGDAVDGCGEETGQGRAGNLVGKILQQSLAKVPGKELEKTKPGKPVVKKVPKQKPRIDGPVFSQSPIPMKKVKLGGRQKKTTNFMSEDEEDGGLGLDGRLEGGEEEDNLARSSFFSHFFSSYFFSFS